MSDVQTVEQLTASLSDLTDEQLTELRAAEEAGENRTTALSAIDAEISRRASAKEKTDAEKRELDTKAQSEGFADHAGKVDAESAGAAAAKKKPGRAKGSKSVDAAVTNERGLAEAREAIDQGKADLLLVGFGDDRKAFPEIPLSQADMRFVGPRLVTGADILMRTGKLGGAVEVTHAWLIGSPDSVLARAELGAPMTVAPGQQIKIAAGRLAFI